MINKERIVLGDRGVQQNSPMPTEKYSSYKPLGLADRSWPGRTHSAAPLWCSVDLRDGNQSLLDPMDLERKRRMFDCLVSLGFKEIEVGYPTASNHDYEFIRALVETKAIPDDVIIQVMAPIRKDLIARTVESVAGAKQVILQIFNPISEIQRRLVFRMSRAETIALALEGAEQSLRLQDSLPGTEIYLQYGPESYTQTEPGFALEICNAVLDFWAPRAQHTLRINLPSTVEVFPPHEFADRVEYMSRNLAHRDRTLLSVHPHNDRGSAVAAAEMAVLAGAQRVEGTLFGNGERSGNVCLVTLAMNLFSQGIDPMLDLGDIDGVRRVAESCNQMPVSPRHPWAGDFAYTSFAGSHQDAIAKGLKARRDTAEYAWNVPYLPIDPQDIGRDYQALIRINTQSGKGGIAHLLQTEHGLNLPRRLQIDFAAAIQRECEQSGGEITVADLWRAFEELYILPGRADATAGFDKPFPADVAAWTDHAEQLLATAGILGQVVGISVDTAGRNHDSVSAFCEVEVDSRSSWGVGVHEVQKEAARAAVSAAITRAGAGVPNGMRLYRRSVAQ